MPARFCAERGMDRVDILKMDIQGGELAALKGAAALLSREAIGVIALEVLFQPLYKDSGCSGISAAISPRTPAVRQPVPQPQR